LYLQLDMDVCTLQSDVDQYDKGLILKLSYATILFLDVLIVGVGGGGLTGMELLSLLLSCQLSIE